MSRLYPCVYCTEDGYCEKYSDDEVTSWCVQGPCKDERPSNADRIRAMSDEEMAEFMAQTGTEYSCPPPHYFAEKGFCRNELVDMSCKLCWLDWLKQEATVVGRSDQ